jgi:hypothetical protein
MVFSLVNGVSARTFWPAMDVRAAAMPVSVSVSQRAGNGNRTRMASLEGWNFTIKLCPHETNVTRVSAAAKCFFGRSLLDKSCCRY